MKTVYSSSTVCIRFIGMGSWRQAQSASGKHYHFITGRTQRSALKLKQWGALRTHNLLTGRSPHYSRTPRWEEGCCRYFYIRDILTTQTMAITACLGFSVCIPSTNYMCLGTFFNDKITFSGEWECVNVFGSVFSLWWTGDQSRATSVCSIRTIYCQSNTVKTDGKGLGSVGIEVCYGWFESYCLPLWVPEQGLQPQLLRPRQKRHLG